MTVEQIYVGPPNAGVVMLAYPFSEGKPEEQGVLAMHSSMCGCIERFHSECLISHQWLRSECGCVSIMACPAKNGFVDMIVELSGEHPANECFVTKFLSDWREQVHQINDLEKML